MYCRRRISLSPKTRSAGKFCFAMNDENCRPLAQMAQKRWYGAAAILRLALGQLQLIGATAGLCFLFTNARNLSVT